MSTIGLRSFDDHIFHLAKLSVLNSANNRILSVLKALECLHLTHLSLKSNWLATWLSISKYSALTGSLKCLDLSENTSIRLAEDFWNLENWRVSMLGNRGNTLYFGIRRWIWLLVILHM